MNGPAKSRDVALGAPGLDEQIPIRNQREVEIEEQAQDGNSDNPPCQLRRQVGPPDPEAAPENQRQEQEEQQRPGNIPGRDLELRVNRIDGEGQPQREGDHGRDGQDHQQRGGDADIRLGYPGEDGSERHTCTQGCDTEPDFDLSRNGRGDRQHIADEQERDDDEIDHQHPHGNLPMGKGLSPAACRPGS